MDKKQLNFSAPLLSARRYSSPLRSSIEDKKDSFPERNKTLPCQKSSDVNLGEVVKPGSVPFIWEQIPGKAKGGSKLPDQSSNEPSSNPKLPPGRSLEIVPWTSGKESGEQNALRSQNKLSGELKILRPQNKNSGELIVSRPGNKLSGELKFLRAQNKLSGELVVSRPQTRFSGEINGFGPQNRLSSSKITSVARWDSSREAMGENSDSDLEHDNATYSDAPDTFSQLESFSINCSVSGLSGSECHGTRPHGTLPTDVHARDFMMNRFLPAAKAMTLDSPQYTSKKQLVAVEQPCEVKALVPRVAGPPPTQNVLKIIPYTGQDVGSEETEDEDEDESCDLPNNVSVKACGFLPWFCSKKHSLRMLNPVPAMKLKTKSALSSASKIGRMVKTGSHSSPSRSLSKHTLYGNQKHKVDSGIKTSERHHTDSKAKSKPRPMFYSGELQSRNSLSPYRNYRRSSVSPCRNESPHSVYHKGVGFLAVPKIVGQHDDHGNQNHDKDSKKSEELVHHKGMGFLGVPKIVRQPDDHGSQFQDKGSMKSEELLSQQRNARVPAPGVPVVEKTLYIDSASTRKVLQTLSKTKRLVDTSSSNVSTMVESLSSSSIHSDIMKGRAISKQLSSNVGGEAVTADISSLHQSSVMKPGSSECTKMLTDVNTNMCRELVVKADDQGPLPPPLPKSPSDSWLSRNLASGSPRNSFSYSSLGNKGQTWKQNPKTPTSTTKWETIVKTSHLRHDHGRYSEELVTHVSQQPRPWK